MSSNQSEQEEGPQPIQQEVEHVYRQYQQAHLYETLDDVASKMERQLLEITIANELLDTEIEISSEAKEAVETAQRELDTGDFDELENRVEATKQKVESEESRLSNKIPESRVNLSNTVEALSKLNREVGFMDDEELDSLAELLNSWAWESEIDWDNTETIEERITDAERFARHQRSIFEEATDAIGEEFEGSEVQTLVKSLLTGDGISLTDLDTDQREALAESELADHIELSLG